MTRIVAGAAPLSDLTVLPLSPGPPLVELAAALPDERWPMLLDSGSRPSADARWDLLVFDPVATLSERAADEPVTDPRRRLLGRLEAALDAQWPTRHEPTSAPGDDDELPPFRGGAVGILGYDAGRELERLPVRAAADAALPDALFGVYPFVVAHDRLRERRLLVGRGSLDEARAFADEVRRAARLARPPPSLRPCDGVPRSTFDRRGYLRALDRIREHILAGDIYQVNLAQRFEVTTSQGAASIHAALRARSSVPFGAVLRTPMASVVSNSPELFLRRRGRALESRPIKGTRPRGESPAHDALLRQELEQSDKENAELAMIVDLVRNDLGRSAVVGSVRARLPFDTEAWATVFHRVGVVRCALPAGARAAPVVEAAFPAASITGAPKIRAMEIIERLEPVRRHFYTGAVGWFDAGGDFELSVAIRIATQIGRRLLLPVGGGITVGSQPADEYEETLHKARAAFDVLGLELPSARALA